MATRTIANGGGLWSSTATWAEAAVPTASDDVVATGTSGALTIDAASSCRSIDLTGYTSTVTHNAFTLTIGTSTANGTKALLFPTTGWTYTLANAATSAISFVSTVASTTLTVDFGGKTTGNITFNSGTTTTHQLSTHGFNTGSTATVTQTQGTFDTNGMTGMSWGAYSSTNANTRTLTLGASTISLTSTTISPVLTNFNSVNMTINPGTAVITFTGASAGANIGSALTAPWCNFVFTGGGNTLFQPAGSMGTLANLTFTGSAVKTDIFRFNGPFTVTGTATFTGNSTINRLLVTSTGLGVQWTITAGVTSLSNVDFMDVAGAGAAAWTGTSIGDGGGNSGITFTAPQTNYWVGGATNPWSNVNSWASSSGGVSGTGRVPLPQDTANINGSSGFSAANTITIDMPRYGTTDFTGAPALNWSQTQASTCFGSYTVASGMTRTSSGANVITFGGRGSYTLKTANMSFPTTTMSAVSGTYTQQDNYGTGGNGFTLTAGTWDMNNFDLGTNNGLSSFFSTAATTRQLNAYAGNIFLSLASGTPWSVTSAGLTLNITSATIAITSASTSTRTFAGGNMSYGTLTYTVANSPGLLAITGNNTFNAINVNSTKQLQFPASGTQTITNTFNVNGAVNGYQRLPGVAANYISTPDAAVLRVTGDLDIRVKLALDSWTPASVPALVAKWGTANLGYEFYVSAAGALHLDLSFDGTTPVDKGSSVGVGFAAGTTNWVRVTRVSSTGVITFYTASGALASPAPGDWTQLGTTVAGTTGAIFASTAVLEVGSNGTGAGALAAGNFYRAQVYNGIAGTLVFDADFTAKTVGVNTFTESSVNAATVTINGVLAQAGDGRVALTSSTGGTQSTLVKSGGGVVACDYLTVQDINVTPATATVGVLSKQTNVPVSAALSFAGALAKLTQRGLTAGVSLTGSLIKGVQRALSAAVSFAGNFTASHLIIQVLTAALSLTGSLARQTNRRLIATLSFAGVLQRAMSRILGAALSFTGAFSKLLQRALPASLSLTGTFTAIKNVVNHYTQALASSLGFTGAMTRRTAHSLAAAALSFTGSCVKALQRKLTASLGFTGVFSRGGILHTKILTASLNLTGAINRRTKKTLTAAVGFIGRLIDFFFGPPRYKVNVILAQPSVGIALQKAPALTVALSTPIMKVVLNATTIIETLT